MINDPIKYPLLPFARLIWEQMQYLPEIYRDKVSLTFDTSTIDVARLQEAVEKALRHHPVFSMVVTEQGEQYFQPSDNILKGQFHSVEYAIEGNTLTLLLAVSRLLGDSYSFRLLFQDVFRVYKGRPLFEDKYVEYLRRYEQLKSTEQYEADRQWYEANFGMVHYEVRPKVDTDQPLSQFGAEGVWMDDLTDIRPQVQYICDQYKLSASQYISLCATLAIMDYNGADSAALTWAYLGRETMDEMAIFGSLHRDIPIKITKKDNPNKQDLLKQIQTQMEQSIAHSLYPYTLLAPQDQVWNYAVNVLTSITEDRLLQYAPIPVELHIEETRQAMSLLDIDVFDDGGLLLAYRYSASHYKPESIQRFAALVRKYVLWLVEGV
jgi:hypothetical protein